MSFHKLIPCHLGDLWEKKVERQRKIQKYKTQDWKENASLQVGEPLLVQDVKAKKAQWKRGYCRDKLSSQSFIVEVDGQLLHI